MRLRFAIMLTGVMVASRAFAEHCPDAKCPTWKAAWTGEFVNVQYAPQIGGKDQYGIGWLVPGVWFRIDNHRSEPVRVCFSFKVYTVEETLTTWDRNTGEWVDYEKHSTQRHKYSPNSYCLIADAGKVSEDHILTADTRSNNAADDIMAEVFDVDVQLKDASPGTPLKRPAHLALHFQRAQDMSRKATPEVARAKQACLRGTTSSCAPQPQKSQLKPSKCFAAQASCQDACFDQERSCVSDRCLILPVSKRDACITACAVPACYSACPVCN